MGKCKHFYGPVCDDGYQYCEKCGEAKSVPCSHPKWILHTSFSMSNMMSQGITGYKYVQRCEKCGELKIATVN